MALVLGASLGTVEMSAAQTAPVGQGFNLNASDLRFILKQIKIAERHVADTTSTTGPCGALLGNGADKIPDNGVGVTLPWGLRTVDGTCNNIVVDQADFGAADRDFPRLVPRSLKAAENGTTYASNGTTVVDSQPRVISNLIVDQTAANPAAVEAAGDTPEVTPSGAFFIPNVATDVGLSAPFNSWFTLFGQFFDHGLDLVNKGENGTVFVPLKSDDPLFDPTSPTNFMVLTRATHDGDHEHNNQTSPFVDQSQTYTSHPSHQVFLREYVAGAGGPVATGGLITGPGGGMATWSDVKVQAADLLGIQLVDTDALRVPQLLTDPYGRFVRGPNGYPQLVVPGVPGGLVEGNPSAPVPTTGATPSGHAFLDDIAHDAVPDGSYDAALLGAHYIAGDGRVNENIGLTAVHHIFHSEHNRLAGEIDTMLDGPDFTDAERADWHSTGPSGWDYGERLFQAARFVTEMQYQHLAFEEFIRKVQPMVNLFGEGGTGYHSEIDPAITAEFAHAVYRFGHSMLTESVDRVTPEGAHDDIQLLDAFLNPESFFDGESPAADDAADQAAGNIIRGMTRQVGNEIDEFVTEALRNDLLGLPLDLATLNMARARETGIPGLNAARRAFYAQTSNTALAPYTSWADLGFSLKHPASLANFIAAYGTHETITSATTTAEKRTAAEALLANASDPDPLVHEDAIAFLNSTDAYASTPDGVTTTGVDDIDLWVGGLAEKTMVFGGLLGPTFNYVFERQAENLQDGDRFYYLSRTAGLNLLTQLEGNSFAELIQRNTDVEGLPADSFSRPDLVFNLGAQNATGPLVDDTATEYDERALLSRAPDGTIRYAGPLHAVFNGADTRGDLVRSSEGDDTLRGNGGNDRLEGGDGADNLIGGLGDDILTDVFGDDVIKGGDGNDTISSGQGFGGDLNQGGRGHDFIIGGNDITESFAGPGNDFVFAGDAEDTVFGDDGDDWIEGGKGPFNLLQGDNGAPFQDDPNEPGHDVLFSYGGEQDYDSEGGDDIMLAGPGIQRAEGMLGFDWVSHRSDPQAGNSDMDITGLLPPSVETNRDRFDLVESLSGWNFPDVLRGDSRDAAAMVGHELSPAGVARVAGLQALLGGATSFTGGNILVGGAGGDLIEGRGGDDLIDGDAWLNVQLRAPNPATPDPADVRLVDTMAPLQADVLAGLINPGDISIVRSIVTTAPGTAVDVALFSGPFADYDVTRATNGTVTVAHTRGTATDGTDTVRNVETLRFADQDVLPTAIPAPAPQASLSATALQFGSIAAGTTSAPQTLVVTNTGTAPLLVTGVTTSGTNAGAFTVSNGCTVAVAAGQTCSVGVSFTAAGVGSRTAQLSIAHNAAGSPAAVTLTGSSVAAPTAGPVMDVVTAVDLGIRRVGQVRTVKVRVTNQGPGTLTVTSVSTTGSGFSADLGTCGAGLAVGRKCDLNVSFTPTTSGAATGTLTVRSNASGDPRTVSLTGTGR